MIATLVGGVVYASQGPSDPTQPTTAVLGLVALGFSSVYREGFEVVLFLQNLELQAGTATVLEGVGIGLAATVAVGAITFVSSRSCRTSGCSSSPV